MFCGPDFSSLISLSVVPFLRRASEERGGGVPTEPGRGWGDAVRRDQAEERQREEGTKRVMGTVVLEFWMLSRGGEEVK